MSVISEHQETDSLAVSLAEVTRGFLSCSGDTSSLEGKQSYFWGRIPFHIHNNIID